MRMKCPLAPGRYAELPHTLGCEGWLAALVATCGELDAALSAADRPGSAVYVEVVSDAYDASPPAVKLRDATKMLCTS